MEVHGFTPGTADLLQLVTYVEDTATDSERVATSEGSLEHSAVYFRTALVAPNSYQITVLPAGEVFYAPQF